MAPAQPIPQYASVEQHFEIDPPVMHCPIRGLALCKWQIRHSTSTSCRFALIVYGFLP